MPATDTEALVLQMSAELKQFQNQMLRAAGEADKAAQRIERRFQQQNQRVVQDFNRFGNQVRTVLATIGVGIIARDVTQLADTWTTVGNRLAFAGVATDRLADTQQRVADIASRTRGDLDATADLFSRMYRVSQDLGLSQERVLRITETVNKALAGASQTERAGAIRQLGQGLGSGRLQGDELRSILENSRPIAEAIAREFDTTVGNLRRLGAEGALTADRIVRAIEAAAPEIDAAFARTTFTVADAFNRLRTEAARFVGTNDRTKASIKGLGEVIDFVADNFQTLADATILTATVMGGTFAGVAVARTIGALGQLTVTAAGAQRVLTALGGTAGIALGVLGGAIAYVVTQTDLLATSEETLARASDASYTAIQRLASLTEDLERLAEAGESAADQTSALAAAGRDARERLNALAGAASNAEGEVDLLARTASAAAQIERDRTVAVFNTAAAENAAAAAQRRRTLAIREFVQGIGDYAPEIRARNEQQNADLRGEIATLEAQARDYRSIAIELGALDDQTYQQLLEEARRGTRTGGGGNGGTGNGANAARQRADLQASHELTMARLRGELERIRVLEDSAAIEERTAAYVNAGREATEARAIAEREVRAEREASNAEARRTFELSDLQEASELARLRNNVALADRLSDQYEIQRRTADIAERLRISDEEALRLATDYVEARREALDVELQHNLDRRDLENELDLARARGDSRTERAILRRLELEDRIAQLRSLGVDEGAAIDRATQEVEALERADLRGRFRAWFGDGVRAAMESDLDEFARERLREWAADGFERALNQIGDFLFDIGEEIITQALRGGQDGAAGALSTLFDGLLTGANETGAALKGALGAAAAEAAAQLALSSTASATSAAKEVASAAQKSAAVASEIAALGALTQAALAAAAALASVGASKGGSDFASIVLKSLSFGGGKASGGGVRPGNWYMVGENGPEPFVPTAPGVVIPNGALEGLKLLGQLPRFTPPPAAPSVNVNVVNQSGVNVDASVRPSADGVGFDVLLTRQTENALRSGRHDAALRDRWGLTPPRTRRS